MPAYSPKIPTKEISSIRRIQKKSIRHIEDIVCEDSGRYQSWFLLQETSIRQEEEEEEPMAKTMEQYMSKTRANYGSGVVRPKIKEKDSFELKGQFLKELRSNTFSGSDQEDANEHIEKVLKIVDLFHIPNITVDQVMLRALPISPLTTKYCSTFLVLAKKMEEINNFQQEPDENLYQAWERFKELLMKCPQYYLTEMHEVVLFYNGLDVPTRQILDSRGAVPSMTTADAKKAIQVIGWNISNNGTNGTSCGRKEGKALEEAYYTQFGRPFQGGGYRATAPGYYQRTNVNPSFQERRQSMEDTLNKFMSESAKRHEENSNLIKEILASTDAAIRNQGALIKTLEIQIRQMSKIKPIRHKTVKYPKGIAKNVLVGIGKFTFLIDFIILDMPEDVKVPLILGRPFLSTAHAKIDVYKRKITLRVGEENIILKSVKPTSSIIKRVYMLSLRERMELDLEARLMGETLVSNRSLNPFSEDYIELNDLNEPFELRRNQGDDLMPTNEEGEVIAKFRTRDEDLDTGIHDYPSYCDDDKKIHINCSHNLKFSCMIGFEFTNANFFPLLYVNIMSRKFHHSIMKNKMVYKGNNVVGALMNVPIFVGTFSVMTDFAVLKDMDANHDNEKGDIIFGEPFLKEVGIKTKWFEGIITLYNGDNEVTYQMVRSHLKFKHHTNEQCNKIPPLLKVSENDMIYGISHAYQKLKGFYKGVLNLGPDFIQVRQWKNGSHAGTLACMRPREGNIDEYWWRIYKSGNLEVLES
ncbi:putative reverse transcriptase domain-containing protein [Tanacetum coccineum]|uniref:Reverse transcriptase domain-containing protein n=1 Tax=Tanacetum coccineum TaxID=301880 RepID=A0ABQ5H8V6_9ASTR